MGPALIVLLGCNALTSAAKLLIVVVTNHLRVKGSAGFEELGSEDVVVFLGGYWAHFWWEWPHPGRLEGHLELARAGRGGRLNRVPCRDARLV
jgi:hypothetical protein